MEQDQYIHACTVDLKSDADTDDDDDDIARSKSAIFTARQHS